MFDNVVVGVDEDHSAGRDALALARQMVSTGGHLTLVYVQRMVHGTGPEWEPVWYADARRHALDRVASLRDEAQIDAELMSVQAKSAAAGLHEVVRRQGDLLVIGASRRDDFERMYIGDDTREVLKDPPTPVAVAPAGYAPRAPALKRIGVAYDGSSGSEQALAFARSLAAERGASLSAFEAVPEPIRVRDPWHVDAEVAELVTQARERVAALDEVEPHAGSGDAAEALAQYARSVDLLVLGSHRHRQIDELMGGSTSQRLAEGTPCPLLVLGSG
jgi:nucleotide-binding universal stress UspA family protein